MSDSERSARIEVAREAVLAQVERLHHDFGRAESRWKADGSRVTETDLAISQAITEALQQAFPEDQVFSEELPDKSGPVAVTSRYVWVLDPIDGTNNFALGIPHCAISLGMFEDGQPVHGVVYDYSRRSLMEGGPGREVTDGGRPVRVSGRPFSPASLVGLHSPTDKRLLTMASGVMSRFKIRGLGSATLHLAYVANGMLEGCVDFNVKIWDLAGAIPLALGAGAEVHFVNGAQFPLTKFDLNMPRITYLAGRPDICAEMKTLMGLAET